MQDFTISGFIESKCTAYEKIVAIDALIDKAILEMANAIDTSGVAMYELDDQQVRIKTTYRSIEDITKGIAALRKMRLIYVNQINGRTFILRDRGTIR